jgi:gas vesicle protein
MRGKNWPEITSAFVIGIGLGALTALVLAPQSGEETRAFLKDKAQEGVDEVVARGKKVARRAQNAADSAKEFVGDAMDAGASAYRDTRNS